MEVIGLVRRGVDFAKDCFRAPSPDRLQPKEDEVVERFIAVGQYFAERFAVFAPLGLTTEGEKQVLAECLSMHLFRKLWRDEQISVPPNPSAQTPYDQVRHYVHTNIRPEEVETDTYTRGLRRAISHAAEDIVSFIHSDLSKRHFIGEFGQRFYQWFADEPTEETIAYVFSFYNPSEDAKRELWDLLQQKGHRKEISLFQADVPTQPSPQPEVLPI